MDELTQTPTYQWLKTQDAATRVAMIRDVTEIVRIVARELFEDEVAELAGARHSRDKPHGGRYVRHGSNPGSIQIGEQRVPVEVPRVRDRVEGACRTLETYTGLHTVAEPSEGLLRAIALGIGTRNFKDLIETAADGFGVSKSRISASFVERSAQACHEFRERSLPSEPISVIMIDGKTFQRQQIIVALGFDRAGEPFVLDMIQSTSENARTIADMLRRLIKRGMRTAKGVLIVCDGSKGITAAAQRVLGDRSVIQRCRVHKAENVASYLPKELQAQWRRRLFAAWKLDDYRQAKTQLLAYVAELKQINPSAAQSLLEGLEETLTLQRLGMNALFGRSLGTTNRIENLNRCMERFTRQVSYWSEKDQRLRWAALAALHHETRMNRLGNYQALDSLALAISKELRKSKRALAS